MIYALVLFACIDGFVDFAGYVPDAALPTLVDTDSIDVPIDTQPQVREEVLGSCAKLGDSDRICAARAQADSDTSTCASGNCSPPARRFQPLRNFFRGRR